MSTILYCIFKSVDVTPGVTSKDLQLCATCHMLAERVPHVKHCSIVYVHGLLTCPPVLGALFSTNGGGVTSNASTAGGG